MYCENLACIRVNDQIICRFFLGRTNLTWSPPAPLTAVSIVEGLAFDRVHQLTPQYTAEAASDYLNHAASLLELLLLFPDKGTSAITASGPGKAP